MKFDEAAVRMFRATVSIYDNRLHRGFFLQDIQLAKQHAEATVEDDAASVASDKDTVLVEIGKYTVMHRPMEKCTAKPSHSSRHWQG